MKADETIIKCENITIQYGNTVALTDVSFELTRGDYCLIVGSNGSGKSTLMKGILGLTTIKSGSIAFEGGVTKKHIGYLPQQTVVQRDFPASVYEVVLSGCVCDLGFRPFYNRAEKEKAIKNMELLDIAHLKKESYRYLSGGQQQRVLLARALCATDCLLFLDEPITGLDPNIANEFYELVGKLNKEKKITILMTSHDLNVAMRYSNKILHIDRSVTFFGNTKDYLNSDKSKILLGGNVNASI